MLKLSLILSLCTLPLAMSAQTAFPPTPPDRNEIKTLPAGILLQTAGRGNYFDGADNLFGPLFRYISRHKIAMTTPVEARIESAAMLFWVAPAEQNKLAGNEAGVEIITVPARRVASRGERGGYTRENFIEARAKLLAWVATQPNLAAAGEPYAVYWNAPFVPFFMKRFEVHVPVRTRATGG